MLSGCTHIIRRMGYKVTSELPPPICNLVFWKNGDIDTTCYRIIGVVKLKDSGFSTRCSEIDALEILRREGCRIAADVVNVIDEERSDISSSCYRVKAQLLQKICVEEVTDAEVIGGQYEYNVDSSSVAGRVSEDQSRTRIIRIVEYSILAFLASLLCINVLL